MRADVSGMVAVLRDVADERARQHDKWGQQDHLSLDRALVERPGGCTPERMAEEFEIPTADRARSKCQLRGVRPDGDPDAWASILVEELCEAVEAGVLYHPSESAMRAELVQVAAVAVAWIEAIDRRANGGAS